AIGDLQGCHAEFDALLDRLKFEPARDRLWLTGDLVNRGPDSLQCLRAVRASRPLLHRDDRLGWTLIHAGLAPEWTLDDAEACAVEASHALQHDPGALPGAMYGD